MYINKIDELVDKIIDDFYNYAVLKTKDIGKIFAEVNFVKHQTEINKILVEYQKTIDEKEIYDMLENEDNVKTVINMIRRYIGFYFFLTIGFHYTGKKETFINNIIEFSKNQGSLVTK
jgi:hypothetical protein